MPRIDVNPCSTVSTLQALNNDIVVDEIISHLGDNPNDLIKYRLVSRNFNDAIVRKVNKSGTSLQIPLRYGPDVPLLIVKSQARRWAKEILKTVSNTLTGTASKLLFNTVVVYNDFYLAGVKIEWTRFLEIHGRHITHLKFKIRSHEFPKSVENHVTDCEEIVSMENLVAAFSATPNLEYLYFSIRFSNYSSEPKLMIFGNLPSLYKLTNITIREPKGIEYPTPVVKKILGMAPANLTSLCIKPSCDLSTHARALKSIEKNIKQSWTSLKISNAHFHAFYAKRNLIHLSFLHLTILEVNNICGVGSIDWIEGVLKAQHSSLIKLILGNPKCKRALLNISDITLDADFTNYYFIRLPPVMEHLKSLEINLTKFRLFTRKSYQIQFPSIESLTVSGASVKRNNRWTVERIFEIFAFDSGRSLTMKHFSLIGPILKSNQKQIIIGVTRSFPEAEYHFHSESDHQYAQEMQSLLPALREIGEII